MNADIARSPSPPIGPPPAAAGTARTSEADRLRILAELDFARAVEEPAFGALTVVLKTMLDVRTASVIVIGTDTIAVKSIDGGSPGSMPRSGSFADEIARTGKTLVVPDARRDPRFSSHPYVTRSESPFSFYAGIPLTTSDGAVLGTVGGFDTRGREQHDPHKMEILEDLARATVARLELKASAAKLRRQEVKLSRRMELVEATIQNVDQGVILFDRNAVLVTCNQHALDILRFPEDVVSPEFDFERACAHMVRLGFYGEGDPEEIARTRVEALRNYKPSDRERLFPEREIVLRDGRSIILKSVPIEDGFLSTYRDVTTERNRAQELKRIARHYELHSQIATIANEAADVASALCRFVRSICLDLGYEIGCVSRHVAGAFVPVGLPFTRVVPVEPIASAISRMRSVLPRRVVETGDAAFGEIDLGIEELARLCGKDRVRSGFAFSITVPPDVFVIEAYGAYSISYGALQVSLLRHLEMQLLSVAERERATRAKEEFVSTISHELRTPLTSVSGMLDLMGSGLFGRFGDDAQGMIETGIADSRRLGQLIEDILTIHRIDHGVQAIRIAPHRLEALVHEAARPYAERHAVLVRDETGGLAANTDPARFEQALGNLLAHAVKSSPAGHPVGVTISTVPGWLRTSVRDEGHGIPEAFRDGLFDTCALAGESSAKRAPGMGLGLAIAKRLIVKLGGRLSFDTIIGEGTTFHVDMPIAFPWVDAR